MRTLVIFVSRQGCSERSARLIRRMLGDDCDIANLESLSGLDLGSYDTVVLGGPIYFGRMHRAVRDFCKRYREQLLTRRLGLYICCMQQGEAAAQEFRDAFPPELLAHASAHGIFGGEIHMERISFVQRFVVRTVLHSEYNVTTFSEERVARFVRQLMSK